MNTMHKAVLVVAGAAALLGCSQASAQVPPAPAVAQPGTAPAAVALPPSRWTVQQIRQAFELADSDSDGKLSRAEAQRLAVVPRAFEDMDQNKDGILSRAEYEAAAASR